LIAGTGVAPFGVEARKSLGGGFSLFGGAAFVDPAAKGLKVDDSLLIAGGLRYVGRNWGLVRPFAEAGLWGAPNLAMHLTRRYDNGTGFGDVDGSLLAAYGRAGLIYAPDAANEFVFSGT